jgi:hypothetical protein
MEREKRGQEERFLSGKRFLFGKREDRGLFKELVNEVNAGRDRSTPA